MLFYRAWVGLELIRITLGDNLTGRQISLYRAGVGLELIRITLGGGMTGR